jgi:Flp pilus assembly protein CpaB
MIAAGVLLVLIAALLVGVLYSRAGGKIAVIVTARSVPVGHVITRADLTTAQIAADTIPAYAGAHMTEVVGKTAAVGLVAGEIVAPAMLTTYPEEPAGTAVVGVAVKPGQLPAEGLSAGDMVMVIVLPPPSLGPDTGSGSAGSDTGGAGAGSSGASVLDKSAAVLDSAELASGSGSVVSLQVPDADAAALAAASSSGLVALVKVPSR